MAKDDEYDFDNDDDSFDGGSESHDRDDHGQRHDKRDNSGGKGKNSGKLAGRVEKLEALVRKLEQSAKAQTEKCGYCNGTGCQLDKVGDILVDANRVPRICPICRGKGHHRYTNQRGQ